MKLSSTSERLKQLMKERNLKQIDIVRAAQPYCTKYRQKLGRSDLSQFVTGKVEPGQWKLTILGLALNVSEAWLMGYDVPMERDDPQPPAFSEPEPPHNLIRIAGRDGSITERHLTDSQLAAVKAILDQMPDSSNDDL